MKRKYWVAIIIAFYSSIVLFLLYGLVVTYNDPTVRELLAFSAALWSALVVIARKEIAEFHAWRAKVKMLPMNNFSELNIEDKRLLLRQFRKWKKESEKHNPNNK
jgi:hypothetical protein